MNITRVKEKFIIVIKLSLRKRQMDYKRASWLQIMEAKTTVKKKKKKRLLKKSTSFLLQFCLLLGPW